MIIALPPIRSGMRSRFILFGNKIKVDGTGLIDESRVNLFVSTIWQLVSCEKACEACFNDSI
jgi:hypothetical protein